MILQILGHSFDYEMECLVRMFYPGERIEVSKVSGGDGGDVIVTGLRQEGDGIRLWASVRVGGAEDRGEDFFVPGGGALEWEAGRRLSVLVYGLLGGVTGLRPPWGVLIGVRPVQLCRKLLGRLGGGDAVREALERDFLVSPHKAGLAADALRAQDGVLSMNTPDSYSLYVGVPFCPSRCLYCSFVTHAVDRAARLVPDYLRLLCEELEHIGEIAKGIGLKLRTVYIGGGTPTTLEPEQLRRLFAQIEKSFAFSSLLEYTVEAGRPDSITREKLAVLKDFGISRISVNPQTMDDNILKVIGRGHTAEQVRESVALARSMGFDSLNMDLIAGLPGQTPDSFSDSLEQVLSMGAQNITVHTLTVKRSSELRTQAGAFERGPYELDGILEITRQRLKAEGYLPYYLYRQQGARQNLENTGFSLPGQEGLYNIFSMEDAHTILAAGAGGVTKLCDWPGRIQRVFNYKYPYEYISGFGDIIKRKEAAPRFYGRVLP